MVGAGVLKALTKAEKLSLLEDWKKRHDEIEAQVDKLGECFDTSTGPLFSAVWGCFDSYTKALAIVLDNSLESLSWFCYENEMGKRGCKAGESKATMRPIKTLEDLLNLIEGENNV